MESHFEDMIVLFSVQKYLLYYNEEGIRNFTLGLVAFVFQSKGESSQTLFSLVEKLGICPVAIRD